jgi:hypothetical protein
VKWAKCERAEGERERWSNQVRWIAPEDKAGWTALHFAFVANQRKTAQKLIEFGVR